MIGITDRPAIAGILAAFGATTAKMPKAVSVAHEHLAATVDRYDRRPLPDPEALPLAVMAALDAGTDPATSSAVQAVLASDQLAANHQMADMIRGICTDKLRTACRDHADDIIAAWRPGFTEAATDLAEAHHALGPIELADADLIVRRGPGATASWSTAQRSIGTIDMIASGWSGLLTFITGRLPDRRYRLVRIAEVEPTRWLELELDGTKPDAWAALTTGLGLRLPTLDKYRATADAIEHERIERTEAAETQRRGALSGRGARVG